MAMRIARKMLDCSMFSRILPSGQLREFITSRPVTGMDSSIRMSPLDITRGQYIDNIWYTKLKNQPSTLDMFLGTSSKDIQGHPRVKNLWIDDTYMRLEVGEKQKFGLKKATYRVFTSSLSRQEQDKTYKDRSYNKQKW